MTAEKQIEDWIKSEGWETANINVGEEAFNAIFGGALLALAWSGISIAAQFGIWSALGWKDSPTDEAPPFFTEVWSFGLALIIAAAVFLVWSAIDDKNKQKALPHRLVREQIDAATIYGRLDDNDKLRAHDALVDYLSYDTNLNIGSEERARAYRFRQIIHRIEEKNRLHKQLTMTQSREASVLRETEMLDGDIDELRKQLKMYKELS